MKHAHMQQTGFTLLELIAVIVILGLLASTAIPKFVNLQQAARVAKIQDLEGKIITARTQAFIACQLVTDCVNHTVGEVVFVPPLNQNIQFINQYPDAGELSRTDQIDDIIATSGFAITSQNASSTVRWAIPNRANCHLEYSQAGYLNSPTPLISKTLTGC